MLECNNGDFEVFWDKDGEIHVDKKIGVGYNEDTDGELAEEYMGDKIGCRHYFDKKNEFETVLV